MTMVASNALTVADYVKWKILGARPEMVGLEVERVFKELRNRLGISPDLLQSWILDQVKNKNGSVLLSQVYSGGSPLSPSTPASHAVVAGACVTVLKFYFEGLGKPIELDVYEPTLDGGDIINTGKKTTVNDELNKLACNVGFGRCWAGVNFRSDIIKGLKLGQEVAIQCLKDLVHKYEEKINVCIMRFSDKPVVITNSNMD
jgi:hypothetical protein